MKKTMSEFKIDVDSFYWIDEDVSNTTDLCLHGHVRLQIGSYRAECDGTVSASALYLLKTLNRDHIPGVEIQLVPCCGFSMFAISSLKANPKSVKKYGEFCEILGCPNGLDWTVKHESDFIRLVSDTGESIFIPFEQYKTQVFLFPTKSNPFMIPVCPAMFQTVIRLIKKASKRFVQNGKCIMKTGDLILEKKFA